MNVKELMDTLSKLDPELRVFTRGYEDGYVDPKVFVRPFALDFHNVDKQWYYGPHVDADRAEEHKIVDGVYIG